MVFTPQSKIHSNIKLQDLTSDSAPQGNPSGATSASGAIEAGGAKANIGPEAPGNEMPPPPPVEKKSLLMQAAAARRGKPEESESAKRLREEQELMKGITAHKALKGVNELAKVRPLLAG